MLSWRTWSGITVLIWCILTAAALIWHDLTAPPPVAPSTAGQVSRELRAFATCVASVPAWQRPDCVDAGQTAPSTAPARHWPARHPFLASTMATAVIAVILALIPPRAARSAPDTPVPPASPAQTPPAP